MWATWGSYEAQTRAQGCRVRVKYGHGHVLDTCQTRSIRVRHELTVLTHPTRSNLAWTRLRHVLTGLWVFGIKPDSITNYNPKSPIFPSQLISLSNPQRRRTLTFCLLVVILSPSKVLIEAATSPSSSRNRSILSQ